MTVRMCGVRGMVKCVMVRVCKVYPEEVSDVIQLHPPVAQSMQNLHPLTDG